MEDQLITFETAEIANKIGINIPSEWFWQVNENSFGKKRESGVPKYYAEGCDHIWQPTQTALLRYLREIKHIHIYSFKFGDSYNWRIDDDLSNLAYSQGDRYKTYEDALEVGLRRGMELIESVTLINYLNEINHIISKIVGVPKNLINGEQKSVLGKSR